jgi:hypothetical protein
MMRRFSRSTALALTLCAGGVVNAFGQAPPLVFTVAVPERTTSAAYVRASAAVEERGLTLWGGTSSDFGVGVDVAGRRWTVRSITSMTALPVGHHRYSTFQQVELMRPVLATESASVAGGGGIRQEWDGTRVLIGRVLAGADVGRGRLQGSLVMERAVSSPVRRDAADVVTSLGWSRRIRERIAIGVEGIGQDLEGFWNPAEAEGGTKLLVGPSVHVHSRSREWTASVTAGPALHTSSTALSPSVRAVSRSDGGRPFGVFASASWVPSRR